MGVVRFVLGPICFVVFINHIDKVLFLVGGFIYKFADDTKCNRIVVDDSDQKVLQENINKLMR